MKYRITGVDAATGKGRVAFVDAINESSAADAARSHGVLPYQVKAAVTRPPSFWPAALGFVLLLCVAFIGVLYQTGSLGAAALVGIVGGLVVVTALRSHAEQLENRTVAAMPPKERREYLARKKAMADSLLAFQKEQETVQRLGVINDAMICPHCQEKGQVRTKEVELKKGISGGKATAALITAGWSILFTGLSRKESATQAYCENCGNRWVF